MFNCIFIFYLPMILCLRLENPESLPNLFEASGRKEFPLMLLWPATLKLKAGAAEVDANLLLKSLESEWAITLPECGGDSPEEWFGNTDWWVWCTW